MKITKLLIILIFITACKGDFDKKDSFKAVKLKLEKQISEFKQNSSSVYVYKISDIDYKKEHYYIPMNGLIYVLNKEFKIIRVIGTNGEGPNEFVAPNKIGVYGDTIYVMDIGKVKFMSIIEKENLIKEWNIEDRYSTLNTFSVDSNKSVFFSTPQNDALFSEFNIPNFDNPIKEFKNLKNVNKKKDDFNIDLHHILLSDQEELIAISPINGVIEVYNKKGEFLQEFYLPNKLIKSRLKYKENQIKVNSKNRFKQYNLINDVYFFNGKIYLLLCENLGEEDEYFCNKIAVIQKNDKNNYYLDKVIELEGESYKTICVNKDFIIGYDTFSKTIDLYRLK